MNENINERKGSVVGERKKYKQKGKVTKEKPACWGG